MGPTYKSIDEFFQKTDAGDKPFFFWLATSDPHRGYKKDSGVKSGIDASKVHLFEHYPDSLEVRKDVADYYFEVQRWDTLVGKTLKFLEDKNLLENTIIIMLETTVCLSRAVKVISMIPGLACPL